MIVTWQLLVERGAANPTYDVRGLHYAFDRLTRYWQVEFRQLTTSSARLKFVMTHRRAKRTPQAALYASGWTISIPSFYRWQNYKQFGTAISHEIGHCFGGRAHASLRQSIMFAEMGDPTRNWSQQDPWWFGRLKWKSNLRPWHEPDYWRSIMTAEEQSLEVAEPTLCGSGGWTDSLQSWWNGAKIVPQPEA